MLSLFNAGAEGGPLSAIRLRELSLGDGVPLTTLVLMAAHGALSLQSLGIDIFGAAMLAATISYGPRSGT